MNGRVILGNARRRLVGNRGTVMEPGKPTHLEKRVLGFFCTGQSIPLATLRAQIAQLRVAERKLTGVGFFTTFHLPAQVERLPNHASASLSHVWADDIPDVASSATFVLWVEDGAIRTLEGVALEGVWRDPVHTTIFTLRYAYEQRDLAKIEAALGYASDDRSNSST